MPNFNLAKLKRLYVKSKASNLTTQVANILVSDVDGYTVYNIKSIFAKNFSAISNSNLYIYRYDVGQDKVYTIHSATINNGNSIVYVSNSYSEVILDTGDILMANCQSNNTISLIINYEQMSNVDPSLNYVYI